MKKQLTIVLFAAMLIFAGAYSARLANAHEREGWRGTGGEETMPAGPHLWRHLRELGLDGKQRAEVKEIRERVEKETGRKKEDMRIATVELNNLLDNDVVDMPAVRAKLTQIASIRTDIRLSFIRAREEIKSILTPEQRKKFMALCRKDAPLMG